jgi:hypothetical protein
MDQLKNIFFSIFLGNGKICFYSAKAAYLFQKFGELKFFNNEK